MRSCGGGTDYLRAVAAASGVAVSVMLDRPSRVGLRPVPSGPVLAAERLPSLATVTGQTERLLASPAGRGWLHGRGLTDDTVRRFRLGMRDEQTISFPVLRDGEAVTAVTRNFRREQKPKYLSARGHPAALYPDVPAGRSVVLVAGMLDALVGRQFGVPTVTTTCGTSLPGPLVAELAGSGVRRVAVVYDVGEEPFARGGAVRLRALGLEAWPVTLPLRRNGADLVDYLHEHDAASLYVLIRRAARASR